MIDSPMAIVAEKCIKPEWKVMHIPPLPLRLFSKAQYVACARDRDKQ